MDKQRSFSLKPTRFLVFSFTISFSIIFLAFFSIWVIRANPTFHQETFLQFNEPSLNLGVTPLTVQSLSSFTTNFSDEILVGTHFSRPVNTSDIAKVSSFDGEENEPTTVPDDEANKGDGVNGNSTGFSAINSVIVLNNSIPVPTDPTHFKRPENASEFGRDSIFRWRVRKENESVVEIHRGEDVIGNSATTGKQTLDTSFVKTEVSSGVQEKRDSVCDVTKGQWVSDESYPLYRSISCPFIDEGFNCEANGRSDTDYMKWRWQPQDCDIPRFSATKMLELIRGKRLVFVGDSINRNQWESMMCLLMGGIKDPKKVYEARGRRITKEKGNYCFKFVDYKCTVEYYVTHFLVHESKARVGKKRVQTLRIDTMDRGSSRWKGADILLFNTAHWWTHFKTQAGINYYQEGDQVHPRLDVSTAFRKALVTWSSWVDKHINPSKTQVFFRSSSPSHFRGGQWNAGGHCREASRPINGTSSTNYPEKNIIVEEVTRQMKTEVTLLNITSLSDYRIDGHPSIYGRRPGKSYSSSSGGQDCSHWCLPGIPDTWNQLLYFHLQSHLTQKPMHSKVT